MPGNLEDKEKCLDKLNQMEKYLPFLDFMINKIKKKNNEISLECQLSKFQLLRSMISEKNGKYTWDVIVKVEDVIKKLIAKLDYKEQYNSPNNESTGCLGGKTEAKGSQVLLNASDESDPKSEMAASISIIPSSSTTTISVANAASLPCVTTVDSRPHQKHNNPVDLIMKTLKISVENRSKNNVDGDSELLSDSLPCTQPPENQTKTETSGKSLETDLDKDLDGFELTDCNTFSEAESNKTSKDSSSEVPVKVSSHVDLLSSSREKLLKSLQKKLYPNKSDIGSSSSSSQSSTKNNSEHSSDSQSICAFSCPSNRVSPCDSRTKSGASQAEGKSEKTVSSGLDKHGSQLEEISSTVRHASPKNLYFDNSVGENKQSNDLGISSSDFNTKQKIREKLSADICEVYRVPGKSVGGSLRSLKDLKDHHKKLPPVEEELFKPDKITEVSCRSSSSSNGSSSKLPNEIKDKEAEKPHRKPSALKNEKKDEKPKDKKGSHPDKHSNSDAKLDKGGSTKSKHPKSSEGKCDETETFKNNKGSEEKSHSPDENAKKEQKTNEANNMNDEELLDFVKENMQFLPHLSKLKSSELRKAVDSTILCPPVAEACVPSDDSFQGLEEFMNDMSSLSEKLKPNPFANTEENSKNKSEGGESHTPVVKTSGGSEGSVKSANTVAESLKNLKPLAFVESKAGGVNDKAQGKKPEGNEDFAQKLIEETTPKVAPHKRKGLLELPMPKIDATFDIPYSDNSQTFSNFSSKVKSRDPRKRKTLLPLPLTYQNKAIPSLLDGNFMNFEPRRMGNDARPGSNIHFNPGMQNDSLRNQRLGGEMGFQASSQLRTYARTKQRNCRMPNESIHRDGKMMHADPRLSKSGQGHPPQDLNQFPCFNSSYPAEQPNDFIFQRVNPFSNSVTNTAFNCEQSKSYGPRPSEPKSYAEYKRMKSRRLKQEQTGHFKPSHTEKAKNSTTADSKMSENVRQPEEKNLPSDISNNSCNSRSNEDKVDKNKNSSSSEHPNASRPSEDKGNSLENSNVSDGSLPQDVNDRSNVKSSKPYRNRKYFKKNRNSRDRSDTTHTPEPYDSRKRIQEERRHSDNVEAKNREDPRSRRNNFEEGRRDERKVSGEKGTEESIEEKKKNVDGDPKPSSDSEEFVSPLDKLYQSENKPKTGRGYGLQSFKIPKKSYKFVPNVSKKPKNKVTNKEKNSNGATKEVKVNTTVKQDSQNKISSSESEVPCMEKVSEKEIVEKDKKESGKEENDSCEDSQVNTVSTTKPDAVASDVADNEKQTQDSCASECKSETENTASEQCDAEVKNNVESVASGDAESEDKVETVASVSPNPEVKEQTEGDASKTETAPALETSNRNEVSEPLVTVSSSETKPGDTNDSVKKVEAQIIECDSSVVNNTANNDTQANDNTSSGKGTVVSKEEITQEFVEALIRKSFQSGEGKLLLAQAKLFEEFARKLNSKKLKTIQKIINSESDSSSSESSESSSEDEKKKKKSKKSEDGKEKTGKSKKHKRKLRRIKKLKSSSSESEGSSEEEIADKKKDETKEANPVSESAGTSVVSPTDNKDVSTESVTSSIETNSCDQTILSSSNKTNNTKNKKRRRAVIFGKCIKRKRQRKQGQKKLLEQILSETSQQEVDRNSTNSPDVQGKESEQKSKPKPKGKIKTELDRLHDDIRSMFISSGVVTATGQRMCRILRESGGNMNNLDIVKESAKMVEEEKLKKVQTRVYGRNSRSANAKRQESRSRSQSRDKAGTSENPQDDATSESLAKDDDDSTNVKMTFDNFNKQPYVVLHKVDLNNFGYGRKISEERISFSQKRGSNKALRGKSWRGCVNKGLSRSSSYVRFAHNVYLPRNLRKCERLKDKKLKRCYRGKTLMDVIKNLPLKMAKMRHLEIGEVKPNEKIGETKRKKSTTTKSMRIDDVIKHGGETKGAVFDTSKLLDYAFKKKQVVYPCKLCSHITKNITAHYKTFHPESEVLISRLGRTEAGKAIAESKKKDYGASNLNQSCFLEMIRQRVKSKLDGTVAYYCRMCNSGKISDVNSFFSHVSGHTGEFRYQCPSEGCAATMSSRENMKFHITWNHSKAKSVLFKKIIELFPVPVEMGSLYGFLCSKCHFVQVLHGNLQEHVLKQHAGEDVSIIKIDMSSKKLGRKKETSGNAGKKSGSKNPSEDNESTDSEEETASDDLSEGETGENEEETRRLTRGAVEKPKAPTTRSSKKRKIDEPLNDRQGEGSVGQNEGDYANFETRGSKRRLLASEDSSDVSSGSPGGMLEIEESGSHKNETVEGVKNVDVDCADLKGISNISGSDIIDPLEAIDKTADGCPEIMVADRKLKVGPFEAQILENSDVLYECCIRGCHFFTKVLDLFEKHVKISHSLVKWNGICQICLNESDAKVYPNKSYRLITALKHLKLHQGIKTKEDEISPEELKIDARVKSRDSFDESEEGFSELITKSEAIGETTEERSAVSVDAAEGEKPFPEKPLLRVRNFLGDRLSTPKDFSDVSGDANDMVTVSETKPIASVGNAVPEPRVDPPLMFTIENVRSLKAEGESEESEIHIGEDCPNVNILKELAQKVKTRPPKPVVVRSCPPRKIAIRPEPSTVPIEVNHPVMLNQLPNSSPITILSSMPHLTPIPKFTVKSVMVSASSSFLTSPSVASALCSFPSSVMTTSSVVTISSAMEANSNKKPGIEDISSSAPKPTASVTIEPSNASTGQVRSPRKRGPTTVYRSSGGFVGPSSFESDDAETKDAPPRVPPASNMGSKSVKDVNIYREMLTKKKLCHLFKCMAIECSFTCNNESIFTQHIGLHEVQRRMKNQKKTGQANASTKLKTVYNWQQCAYCCQVISNTSSALSQHIVIEHGHCMYQCAYCFYRAVTYNYVEIHQNLAHSHIIKNTTRVIYKCKPLSVAPPLPSKALEKHGRRQSVRPYHCYQCRSKFYITQDFMNHLTTEHQSVTAYTCHICENLCFKADRLIIHYKLHSYCTYQCAYCLHGTETEKDMVYHLCNFHFSQPAFMYVRALADNQSSAEVKRSQKRKKPGCNSLDSLKVIIYDMNSTNPEYVVEADSEEEAVDDASRGNDSLEFSSIVAELGINRESEPPSGVSPLIKELASIGNRSPKNVSVKSLLPNAHFSSGAENGAENCSVLISSGLSTDQTDEKDISIPLGQLPLEAISVRNVGSPPVSSPSNTGSQDKNLKLNEIIINLQHKEKGYALPSAEEEKPDETMFKKSYATDPKCIHKLPPVVLSRKTTPKNLYPPKSSSLNKKKLDESSQKNGSAENKSLPALRRISGSENQAEGSATEPTGNNPQEKENNSAGENSSSNNVSSEKSGAPGGSAGQPLITNVVSLSSNEFDKQDAIAGEDGLPKISEVCSLSKEPPKIVINIKSKLDIQQVLKPPIIRVEDFRINEGDPPKSSIVDSGKEVPAGGADGNASSAKKGVDESEGSPDVIILEEEASEKDVLTVVIDSEDEKEGEASRKGKGTEKPCKEVKADKIALPDDTIRKQMELLRNQIASETDGLLFDESTSEKSQVDAARKTPPSECDQSQSLLSPIEEAICSLNKKLKSETLKAQNEEEQRRKEKSDETSQESSSETNKKTNQPRTRSSVKGSIKNEGTSNDSEKCEGEAGKTPEPSKLQAKSKRFAEELTGKDLFICGNEKCTFAAEDDTELKDHMYVCDLSREYTSLVCPHCSTQIKQFVYYLDHLKHHGEKKYSCGLCSFSTAVESSVVKHAKQKHKITQLKSVPNPSKERYLVFYPKNYKLEKQDFVVEGYSPGDEDKLPLQAVYQVNVKCAKCPYFTKVRSNMVRHLKIHAKSAETEGSVVVPSTAPTNPVPCLDTKERMFDKMTNLAASSQLAQAKEKTTIEMLTPEEEAKLPQFVAEQMRYKCCLPDCNYITVDDGMLKHHIKALHDEINYYSCPHCRPTVHVDVRHVTLDKIGYHLKHHDNKLYKCAHCIYFHYQKAVVEKHVIEKHPERRYFVHTIREPKVESASEEEHSSGESSSKMWKCGLCDDFRSFARSPVLEHLAKTHNTKSKYKCQLCDMKSNHYHAFFGHFASKHVGEKVAYMRSLVKVTSNSPEVNLNPSNSDSLKEHFDTTPLWQRGAPRIRHIRGILIEEEEVKTKKSRKASEDKEIEPEVLESVAGGDAFYCPLCSDKKKIFCTRNADCFRSHLYQELNYQQFACILCGKMFVDRKDFDKHHAKAHPDKPPSLKQTKEDGEIMFWVDKVIAKQEEQMADKKRRLSGEDSNESQGFSKKKKKTD